MNNLNGTITLLGSGEFGEGMARVYRTILARAPSEPNAVFLDTPAGFELNADTIAAKAVDYFSQRLQLTLQTASYKHKARATALETEAALHTLRQADFILAGPGSPGYAIRNWQDTPVWETVSNRLAHGAHLVFASAAAIAVGASALPVYEIYKAGSDPYWVEGLNLFAGHNMNLAIVPHWNNSEGGTYDTRYCFMGETRFRELEKMLPVDTVVLGIDEYTACLFDVEAQECRVMGAGSVTIRGDGVEWSCDTGSSFPFAQLRVGGRPSAPPVQESSKQISDVPDETTLYLMQIARALDETEAPDVKRDLIDHAHDTMHELSADWIEPSHSDTQPDLSPYIETFIEIRKQLREAKQYALADEIRKRLADLNIELQDTDDGTVWRKTD
jgi:cyanophycinase-like exopeptidase